MARAKTSLPVPLSPCSSVVAFVGATFSIVRQTLSIASLAAMTPSSGDAPSASRELPILGLERVNLIRALHDQLQRVDVDGLLIEVVGAEADRLHGVALVAVPRDDDHLRERRELQNLAQRGEALADAAVVGRQAEVLQHDRRLVAAQLVDRRRAIGGRDDFVVLEAPAQLALNAGIVLDDQQFAGAIGHCADAATNRCESAKATESQKRWTRARRRQARAAAEEGGDLPHHVLALLGLELGIDRQRQHLGGGALRLREIVRLMLEIGEAALRVQRHGIVDLRADALGREMSAQLVALAACESRTG